MFTFPSEKSHIHLGLWGLSTSWRCMADSRTLEWMVLPSHKDCSWWTTVPIQLRMPKKRSGTKDMFAEWNGLFSIKHKASFVDYTSLVVWECNNFPLVLKSNKYHSYIIQWLPKFHQYDHLSLLHKIPYKVSAMFPKRENPISET